LPCPAASATVTRHMQKTSFTFRLDDIQQERLIGILRTGNYRPTEIPYTRIAADAENCRIALYTSGKCVIQGKGAQDWVTFTLEPLVLQEARLGYDEVHDPEASQPHMGIDESGKGDFFGPLVIAAAFVNKPLAKAFADKGVRDSKTVTSDKKAEEMARDIRKMLGDRYALVTIGPRAYNRLYAKMRNVNDILAWGHARAIENLLEKVPDCPRAVSDQFGPKRQIEQALMKKGRSIELIQRPKAESDPAVAAASILARASFIAALRKIGEQYGVTIPKGASDRVREIGVELVKKQGPETLLETVKCHFRTTDAVLEAAGHSRKDLGPEGQAVSKPFKGRK
jgi:ribonuclease HIII